MSNLFFYLAWSDLPVRAWFSSMFNFIFYICIYFGYISKMNGFMRHNNTQCFIFWQAFIL